MNPNFKNYLEKFVLLMGLIICLLSKTANSQSWTQLPNLPFKTVIDTALNSNYGCGFTLGFKIFYLPADTARLWEYNTISNIWTPKSLFPPGIRVNASAFSIDSFGYITCGRSYGTTPGQKSDLWRYNPNNDSWAQLASILNSNITREQCISFVINGKAYLGGGTSVAVPSLTPNISQLQEYNPLTNTWTGKASIPDINNPPFKTNGRRLATAFSFGNFGYVTNGIGNGSLLMDTRKYNPITNSWTNIYTPFGSIVAGSGTSFGNNGFLCFGQDGVGQTSFNTIWQIDLNDNWTQKSAFPGPSRKFASIFTIACKTYVLGGQNYDTSNSPATTNLIDFWVSNCNTLPVKLIKYKIEYDEENKNQLLINWETSSEVNCLNYIVKVEFENIKLQQLINCNGNSNFYNKYSCSFELAETSIEGGKMILEQIDYDGKINKIIETPVTKNKPIDYDFQVFPNPCFDNNLFIKNDITEQYQLQILDYQGKQMQFKIFPISKSTFKVELGNRNYEGIVILITPHAIKKVLLLNK
jgi:N-acetylneuraminic acid mutarotase